MIDIHSHILANIDDGSSSLDESLSIIDDAIKNGVTDIVITPHYISNSKYNADNKIKTVKFKKLKNKVKQKNINLYLGNEVYVDDNMLELIDNKQILSINKGKYILMELPLNNRYRNIKELVYKLRNNGYVPILAHPERYLYYYDNIQIFSELAEQGVLFQCNIGSFIGTYGKQVKRLALFLLRNNYISFISSDIHHDNSNLYNSISKLKKEFKRYITDDEIEDIFINNAQAVLNNEIIEEKELGVLKKNILGRYI